MTAYAIFQGDITDADGYESYKPLAAQAVEEHGGT